MSAPPLDVFSSDNELDCSTGDFAGAIVTAEMPMFGMTLPLDDRSGT